jgi:TRAP-type uncharacterized transport system fused permease subunit
MLFIGEVTAFDIILIVVSSLVGIFAVSASLEGYILEHMEWYERIIAVVGGLLLIYPGIVTDLIGLSLAAVVIVIQMIKRTKNKVAPTV